MEAGGLVSNLKIVLELFLYIYCLAELFGEKLKIGIHAAVFIIIDLFLMAGINDFGFPKYLRTLGYIAMFLYGLIYYKESIKRTIVNCFLAAVIVSLLPLLLYLPLYCAFYFKFETQYVDLYGILVNVESILLIALSRRKIKLKYLSDICLKKSKLVLVFAILILCGFGFEIYQIIDKHMLSSETCFQIIYFVLIILFIVYEWQKSRMDAEKKKTQLEMNKLYYEAYDQLIMLVRERQHDMKNHINAILSLSYTTENYDELIAKQKEYCGFVMEQNEKTKLVLSSGNPLIAGFLYSKLREAEDHHIIMDYKIGFQKTEMAIPEYELVEMAGILLDNAVEALDGMGDENFIKKIFFSIKETEDNIELLTANTSPYYEEDLTEYFFETGYSSKGPNRGIGLSKLKRLVQNRKGTILVYNKMRDELNYLTFEIKLPK